MSVVEQMVAREERLENFFNHWKFPIFALSTVLFLDIFMFGIFLLPQSTSFWGTMVQDFKVWCFGYDPTTGRVEWSYVVSMIVSSVVLMSTIFLAWGGRLLKQAKQSILSFFPYVLVSFTFVTTIVAAFVLLYRPASSSIDPNVFPAEQLRTMHIPPTFRLLNQDQQQVGLQQFRGKVILLTAVYSTCGYTCPMILAQIKRVIATLTPEQRKALRVMAITLDPARDTPKQLKAMADAHKVSTPFFNLLTGDVSSVNRVLDWFNFSRKRDPKTGMIDHVNLFLLIDSQGKIAYRFTLGKQQESWLTQALRLLIRESGVVSPQKSQS